MREVIKTEAAPQAIGPYSQAIKVSCGKIIYCSGQIPLDPKSGQVVGQTGAEQCRQVMENIKGLLGSAGSYLDQVVKTTIFLTDMAEFAAVNEVYGSYFPTNPPARSTVQVCRLPKDVRIEIEVIAVQE
ncbi:MAG: RidA family protein [candidate division Zixibacteria bacterium]|nr:RidA family protein [candidate division Zixibacteria bacterium]